MNVGTLIALLKLQDEMSPALLDASNRLSSFGSAATSAGLALTAGLTAPIVGMAYAAVNAGVDFESAMNQIAGVTGATDEVLEQIRQTALRMGADTVFSATDAANAMLELSKAGFTTQQAIEGVDDVLMLAAASGLSMAEAAEFAAKTIQGFGLEITDLAHVNDVLAASVNQTALDISDLQVAFGYLGPIATSFGISIEQAAAAMAIMVEAGVPAETAARSIRDALTDLVNPVGQTADAMEMLGIETFKTADGSLMPFADIISLLESKAVTAEQALMLFGKQSGGPMAQLVDTGRVALDALTLSFENSDGAAQKMADAMMKGLPGAIEFLRGSVDTLFITLSKQLEPVLLVVFGIIEDLADFVTSTVIPAFAELPVPVQAVAFAVTAIAAAIGPALVLFGSMAFGLSSLLTLFGTLGISAGGLSLMISTLVSGFVAFSVPLVALGAVLLGAIGGWDGLKAAALGTWEVLQDVGIIIGAVVVWLGTHLWDAITLTMAGLYEFGSAIGDVIKWLFNFEVFGVSLADIFEKIGGILDWLAGKSHDYFTTSYDEMSKLPGAIQGVEFATLELMTATELANLESAKTPDVVNDATAAQIAAAAAAKAAAEAERERAAATKWMAEQVSQAGANVRALYNEWGLELMEFDAGVIKATASLGALVNQQALLAPSIQDNAASLDAYNLIGHNSVAVAGEHAQATREQEAAIQAAGMGVMDFSAHVSNNASQMAAATEETKELNGWFITIGNTTLNMGGLFGAASDAFAIMADAMGGGWATIAAQGAAVAQDLTAIWTDKESGLFDKILNSALTVGAAIGDALFQTGGEDVVERLAHDLGVSITEELGNAINETAEAMFGGDRNAAEIFHLTDLLDAVGGLNATNFDAFTSHFRDVFSMLDTGMFDASQAVTVLSENWDTFVEAGIDGAGRLSPALVEIMDLTKHFAETLASPELANQFVDQWLVLVETLDLSIRENFALTVSHMFDMFDLVAQGILPMQDAVEALDQTWDTFVEEGTNKVTGLLDPALQAAVMTMRQLGIESEAVTAYIADQLSNVVDGLTARVGVFGAVVEASLEDGIGSSERFGFVLNELHTDAAGLQQEFNNLGVYTVATFGALVSEGHGLVETLGLLGESLDQLAQAEHVLGLEGSAALNQLLGFRNIVTSNEEVFASIDAIQQMMAGLANTGYLTQEVFSAFGNDLAMQFDRLAANGVNANDALLLMQPSLQTLWELQHNFGFEVDAGTQALLDQAEAAGLIGGAFQDVMERIEDILLSIANALGAELPDYFTNLAGEASSSFDTIEGDYEQMLAAMESGTGAAVDDINASLAEIAADSLANWDAYITNPGTLPNPINPAGSIYTGPYPPGDPRNPPGAYTPPTGTMTGSGCCINVGPVYVMDGTSPSVGSLFVKALLDELRRGNGMDAFRELLCEAGC